MKSRRALAYIIGGVLVGIPMALLALFALPKSVPSDLGDRYAGIVQRAWSRIKSGKQ